MNYVYATALVLLLSTAELYAQSFEPGIWKSKESIKLNGLPFPAPDGEECISAAQAGDARAAIAAELKRIDCSITKWDAKNQKLELSVSCDNKNFSATGNLKGSFTRKNYDLRGDANGSIRQTIPAVVEMHLTGQWQRACPPQSASADPTTPKK